MGHGTIFIAATTVTTTYWHQQNVLFTIGSAFLYYVNHFKLYSSFCASHSKAQKVLHPSKYPSATVVTYNFINQSFDPILTSKHMYNSSHQCLSGGARLHHRLVFQRGPGRHLCRVGVHETNKIICWLA